MQAVEKIRLRLTALEGHIELAFVSQRCLVILRNIQFQLLKVVPWRSPVPCIIDDEMFWAQFVRHQIVVGVDINATMSPDVDNVEKVLTVNHNVLDLRFRLGVIQV